MIKISLFDEKKSFLENNSLKYVLNESKYRFIFNDGKLTISKFKQDENEPKKIKKY